MILTALKEWPRLDQQDPDDPLRAHATAIYGQVLEQLRGLSKEDWMEAMMENSEDNLYSYDWDPHASYH
jgi:hypothetical protein